MRLSQDTQDLITAAEESRDAYKAASDAAQAGQAAVDQATAALADHVTAMRAAQVKSYSDAQAALGAVAKELGVNMPPLPPLESKGPLAARPGVKR